jgi:uncharacterized membrane protein
MIDEHMARIRRLTIRVWTLLVVSIVAWPFTGRGIGLPRTAIALLPLLLPLPGLVRWRRRTLQWSPLTLAPALALTLTEILVNSRARGPAILTLALIFTAFAAIIAALRVTPRSD